MMAVAIVLIVAAVLAVVRGELSWHSAGRRHRIFVRDNEPSS